MFSVIVIVFELICILFIGIFARTNSSTSLSTSTTYQSLIGDSFTLLLAFVFMYTPYRKLSITSLSLLLIVLGVTVQTNLLFDTFWSSCFLGFSSSFQVTFYLITRCIYASLAVLITVLDFIGLFPYWQIYFLIAPIMAIGYSLIQAIIIYGLATYDGGGGLTIFLYSGVVSLMIWLLCIRGKISPNRYKIKQSYVNQTLSFIGVMIAFANWPKFNIAGTIATTSVSSSINSTISTTFNYLPYLQNSALANTFLGLSASILLSILFASKDSKEDKLKYRAYIDCFINGGIVIAQYQDTALNPVSCIIMACFSTIITVIVHKYFLTASETDSESMFKNIMKNYSKIVFRILFAFFGSIIASIVVASRNSQTPSLLSTSYSYSTIAGFQIVAFIVTLGFGIVFGAITGLFINLFLASHVKEDERTKIQQFNEQITDLNFFDGMEETMHPLYYDIFVQIKNKEEEKINIQDYTTRVIRQSLIGAQDNPLRLITLPKPYDTRVEPNKPSGRSPKNDSESERQDEGIVRPNKPLTAHKSKLKITQDEQLPKQSETKVARKLVFEEDAGSEIKNEKVPMRLSGRP